jgi:hypothetical protein
MDETMAMVLGVVLLFVVVFSPIFGAESRPEWKNVNRRPRSRSMRREDWPAV